MLNAQSHSHCPTALHARTSQQASSCRHLALPERPEAPAGLQPTCPRPQCSLSPAALARSKRYQSNGRPTRRSRPAHASLPVSPPGPACHFQALLPSLSTPAQRLEMRPVLARRLGARSEVAASSSRQQLGLALGAAATGNGPLGVAAMRQQTRGAVGSPAQARERRRDRGSSHMAWHRLGYFAHNKFLQNRKIKCFSEKRNVKTSLRDGPPSLERVAARRAPSRRSRATQHTDHMPLTLSDPHTNHMSHRVIHTVH